MGILTGSTDYNECAPQIRPTLSYKELPCKRDYEAEIAENQRAIDRDEAFLKAVHLYSDDGGRMGSETYAAMVGELTVIIRGRRRNIKFLVEEQEREAERTK